MSDRARTSISRNQVEEIKGVASEEEEDDDEEEEEEEEEDLHPVGVSRSRPFSRTRDDPEKDILKFHEHPPAGVFAKNYASTLWSTVKHIDWTCLENLTDSPGLIESGAYKGITRLLSVLAEEDDPKLLAKRAVICPICFEDDSKTLADCIIMCGKGITSNIGQHQKKFHMHVALEFQQTKAELKAEQRAAAKAAAIEKAASIDKTAEKFGATLNSPQQAIFLGENSNSIQAPLTAPPAKKRVSTQFQVQSADGKRLMLQDEDPLHPPAISLLMSAKAKRQKLDMEHAQLAEMKRHNETMERAVQWKTKSDELDYRLKLFSSYQQLRKEGHSNDLIRAINPEFASFFLPAAKDDFHNSGNEV